MNNLEIEEERYCMSLQEKQKLEDAQHRQLDYIRSLESKVKKYDKMQKQLKKANKYDQLTEQLGCPVEVLIKALENGVWIKDYKNNSFYYVHPNCFNFSHFVTKENVLLLTFDMHMENRMLCYYLSDYKKTWWTKEDKSE